MFCALTGLCLICFSLVNIFRIWRILEQAKPYALDITPEMVAAAGYERPPQGADYQLIEDPEVPLAGAPGIFHAQTGRDGSGQTGQAGAQERRGGEAVGTAADLTGEGRPPAEAFREGSGASLSAGAAGASGTDGSSEGSGSLINPDIVGWLTVRNTGIDYPLLKDPEGAYMYHYLFHDYRNEESQLGSIVLDINTPMDAEYRIIHGHNVGHKGVMFSDLTDFLDPAFCNQAPEAVILDRGAGQSDFYALALVAVVDGYAGEVYAGSLHADYLNAQASWGRVSEEGAYIVLSTCVEAGHPENTDRLVVVFRKEG